MFYFYSFSEFQTQFNFYGLLLTNCSNKISNTMENHATNNQETQFFVCYERRAIVLFQLHYLLTKKKKNDWTGNNS